MAADGGGPPRRRLWPGSRCRTRTRPRPPAPERPGDPGRRPAKPGVACLGVDLASLDWQRSGTGEGSLEVAFVRGPGAAAGQAPRRPHENVVQWVLLRVAGDPSGRVLVYDRVEWLNFLDGAAHGEFDWAAELGISD